MPRGAVGPLAPQRRIVGLTAVHTSPDLRAPCNRLGATILARCPWSATGGVLCRPLSARLHVLQQRRGVSDPARDAHTRPRARPRGRSRLSCRGPCR
jgi:hypothetical protein